MTLPIWQSTAICVALNQLQKVIRIDGAAESIVELLALGTEFSTQWTPEPGSFGPGGHLVTGGSLES